MKKVIYALLLPLVAVSGLVYANRGTKDKVSESPVSKPVVAASKYVKETKWEETPEGIRYKRWEASPIGQSVLAAAAKVRKQIKDSTDMEAIVTSLTLPPQTRLGFAVMASIDGTEYILRFDTEKSQLEQLKTLKANDRLIIKVRGASMAPKYDYLILAAESAHRDNKEIYKRIPPKGGC